MLTRRRFTKCNARINVKDSIRKRENKKVSNRQCSHLNHSCSHVLFANQTRRTPDLAECLVSSWSWKGAVYQLLIGLVGTTTYFAQCSFRWLPIPSPVHNLHRTSRFHSLLIVSCILYKLRTGRLELVRCSTRV